MVTLFIVEPPEVVVPPADQTAIKGATVIFQCISRGASVRSEWLFNGEVVVSTPLISITGQYLLCSVLYTILSCVEQSQFYVNL